jgi:uncharacterized protein with HEPN domain
MPPTLADRVRHILEAIEEIERALAGKSLQEFSADRFLRAGIERLLEIVCEALRHLPDDVKGKETAVAWPKMIDFGNRPRHAYRRIDSEIVWNVIQNDLPPLKTFVERVLRREGG